MRRHVLGLVAATVAAPYLVLLPSALLLEFNDVASYGESFDVLDVLKFLPLGTMTLAFCGIPLLIVAAICAALFNFFQCRTKWTPMLAGALLGFCFVTILTSPPSSEDWLTILAISTLPGAICGWIYWRIAIGRPS